MTWVPPSSGGSSRKPTGEQPYDPPVPSSPGYGVPGYGVPGYGGAPQGVPQKAVKERELRRERALRALPPPPTAPPGMGAKPAFAPPVPRPNRTVLIVSLVLGVTLLLCCGGGVGGFGGLLYYSYNQQRDSAVDAVRSYLGDLQGGRYQQAYGRLCLETRSDRSLDEFADAEEVAGQIATFQVSDQLRADPDGNWVVTAVVARQGASSRSEYFPVVFESGGTATVCP
ncbi:hypothetical protein [Cryptosporangium sp. NPDC048952]|uniref:hypothetical protein n=1 Tax=Cryptosporangium sp. NPDC048952 TaxID=3363961 RepID=UPI00371CCB3D